MSRDAAVIEISSESDSDNECNAKYPFDGISKIELIEDDTDTIEDDDVKFVSITRLSEPVAEVATASSEAAGERTTF